MQPLFAEDTENRQASSVSQTTLHEAIDVSGIVVDENGFGLPGATVLVKGTSMGVVTNRDGIYNINVDESDTLVFSFVGYGTIEEGVAGRTVIDVTLFPETTTLDEVVVTGYQILSKERVTGSFEVVSGEVLQQRPTNNFIDKLEGVASGVAITNTGQVEVRGKSTIMGNASPLYMVDGFPIAGALLTVNPEDIASITVLKDAAAASIWGVRASNGVIVVTTKKGNRKGTKIDFSSYLSITEGVDYDRINLMSTADEIDLQKEYFDKGWYKSLAGEVGLKYAFDQVEIANIYRQGLSPDGQLWSEETYNAFISDLKTKDDLSQWEDLMLQKSIRQTYNLSVASGGENNDVYASLVFNDNLGQSIGNADDRVVLNIRDEFRLKDRFIFNAGVNASMRNNTMNGIGASTVTSQKPYDELVDGFGRPIHYYRNYGPWASQEREAIPGNFPYWNNHLETRKNLDRTRQRIDIRSQFGIGVKIIEGLRFDTKLQYEVGFDDRDEFKSMDLPSQMIKINNFYRPGEYDADSVELGYQIPVGTEYIYDRNEYHAWDWRNTIAFDKSWNTHQVSLFGGAEIRKHASNNLKATLFGYNKQTTNYIPVNEKDYRSGQITGWNKNNFNSGPLTVLSDNDIREVSFFGNGGYTYLEKYSVTGSFRVDQKNLFGSDPRFRYKPLWSTGASWQISKEDFMQGINLINRLTLRVTYGISGNATNKYSPYAQAVPEIAGWGSKLFDLLKLDRPANDQLKWEETATFNVGIDFAILRNRIGGSFEFYDKSSTDLLGNRPLDPTNGFATAIVNYASMNNKGVDMTLRGTILQNKGLKWDARLLLSLNRNVVTDVVNQNIVPVNLAWVGGLRVGQPLENIYSFDYAGLSSGGDVLINTAEGDVVNWRDFDGNEKEEDLIYWGTRKAPIYGGFSSTVSYKGLELTVNMSYKFGYYFKHYYTSGVDLFYYNQRPHEIWTTRWKEPGDELTTRVPKISYYGENPYTGVLEDWWNSYDADWYWIDSQDNILKGGYIKVRDIILGYTIPRKFLSDLPISSIKATVQVTNPYTWVANDRGIDPERIDYNRNSWRYRMSTAAWSGLKTITFGVRASF